jgi:hypothetical protein
MRSSRFARPGAAPGVLCAALSLLTAAGCASTGATFNSGVGDAFPERPPYYAGASVARDSARIAHLPVAYQRGATQPTSFDPSDKGGGAVASLLAEMNAYLDSLGVTTLITAGPVAGTPPDVQFGCVPDATGDCADPDEPAGPAVRTSSTQQPRMRLAVGRPSAEWVASTRTALDGAGAARSLSLTLEVGQYWVTKTGWRNNKSLELGTGHTVKLPWLTSLDAPVSVLQLTGVVADRDGKAVRIGAEGLLARRTGIVMSGLGAQRMISDADVEQLRTLRRDDLPGKPLVWQVALRNLVAQLTGRTELAAR